MFVTLSGPRRESFTAVPRRHRFFGERGAKKNPTDAMIRIVGPPLALRTCPPSAAFDSPNHNTMRKKEKVLVKKIPADHRSVR
jgi:hypothetical protein